MGNFRRSGNSGRFGEGIRSGGSRVGRDRKEGSSFGGNRDKFGGNRGPRRPLEMHDVVCAKCGKQCQVPFKPSRDKPVYCSDCFGSSKNVTRNQNSSSQSFISLDQFNQLNEKIDKIISILEDLEIVSDDDMKNELDEELEGDEDEDLDKKSEDDSDEDSENINKV